MGRGMLTGSKVVHVQIGPVERTVVSRHNHVGVVCKINKKPSVVITKHKDKKKEKRDKKRNLS